MAADHQLRLACLGRGEIMFFVVAVERIMGPGADEGACGYIYVYTENVYIYVLYCIVIHYIMLLCYTARTKDK